MKEQCAHMQLIAMYLMKHATKKQPTTKMQVNLNDVMTSRISQSQKTNYYGSPIHRYGKYTVGYV